MKKIPAPTTILPRAVRHFAFALLALSAGAVAAEPAVSGERHWDLKLADQPSGSFIESSLPGADGNVITREKMIMEINRLGSKVSISNETETVENSAGEMQSVVSVMSSSQAATRLRVTRSNEALRLETEAGGKSYEKQIPFTGTILGPKGIERLSREKLKTTGATISYRMFSPELGNVAAIERKVVGTVEDKGRKIAQVRGND